MEDQELLKKIEELLAHRETTSGENISRLIYDLKETQKIAHEDFSKTQKEIIEDVQQVKDTLAPIAEFYSHMTWVKKMFVWVLSLIALIGAAGAAIKGLFIK